MSVAAAAVAAFSSPREDWFSPTTVRSCYVEVCLLPDIDLGLNSRTLPLLEIIRAWKPLGFLNYLSLLTSPPLRLTFCGLVRPARGGDLLSILVILLGCFVKWSSW